MKIFESWQKLLAGGAGVHKNEMTATVVLDYYPDLLSLLPSLPRLDKRTHTIFNHSMMDNSL